MNTTEYCPKHRTTEGYINLKKSITINNWKNEYGIRMSLADFEEFKRNKKYYLKAVELDEKRLKKIKEQLS